MSIFISASDTGQVVVTLRGHESCVHSISLHSSGRFALAVSSRDSVLWDLDSFTRCRTLNGGEEVGVQDVSLSIADVQ
jgi:WD40 repeat protein